MGLGATFYATCSKHDQSYVVIPKGANPDIRSALLSRLRAVILLAHEHDPKIDQHSTSHGDDRLFAVTGVLHHAAIDLARSLINFYPRPSRFDQSAAQGATASS